MAQAEDFQSEDQVQAPRPLAPPPLAPLDCDGDWKECLDAGQDGAPTTAHEEEGWRAIPTAKP